MHSLRSIILTITMGLILFIAACGSLIPADKMTTLPQESSATALPSNPDMTATPPIDTPPPPTLTPTTIIDDPPQTRSVGQPVILGTLVFTVTNVADLTTSPPHEPSDRNRFLAVTLAVRNLGGEVYPLSSLLQTSVRDEDGQVYIPTLHASLAAGDGMAQTPDGKIAIGAQREGTLGFEIPSDTHTLEFQFIDHNGNRGAVTLLP